MSSSKAASLEDAERQIKDRMVASGDWHRLTKMLKEKLQGSDWEAKLRSDAEQYAGAQTSPNVREIMDHMTPRAQQSIPNSMREEVEAEIRKFIELHVEAL